MEQVVLPLGIALASLFAACIFMSILVARKIPLRMCVVQEGEELRVFVALGRVPDERIKCFSSASELRGFARGTSLKIVGLRDAAMMIVALKKFLLIPIAIEGVGLAISVALIAIALALGA